MLHHMQAAATSAYQRIVSAREAATSGGSSSCVNQAQDLSTQRDPQGHEASSTNASCPESSAEEHHDLAQLLSAAGNAQAALEEEQQRVSMLEASSAALRIAEDFIISLRYNLIQLYFWLNLSHQQFLPKEDIACWARHVLPRRRCLILSIS